MRLLPVLVLLAGCGFQVTGASAGDDAPPPPPDDAEVDTPPDMPVDMSCPDTDGDGVCNDVDRCALGDDNADADGDGIPDACDDWPCGTKPAAPPEVVPWNNAVNGKTENVTLSGIRMNDTDTRFLVVAPNTTFTVRANYAIYDCVCTNCIDQIQLGLYPGEDTQCLYNNNPPGNTDATCMEGASGAQTVTLETRGTTGMLDIRFRRAQGNSNFCNNGPDWWDNQDPSPAEIVAYVCVN